MCMASDQAMIAVKPETRDRIFRYKRPGVSYDAVISEMIDAYEEKIKEPRSPPASNETGNLTKETQ